jgi:hypothetical protein
MGECVKFQRVSFRIINLCYKRSPPWGWALLQKLTVAQLIKKNRHVLCNPKGRYSTLNNSPPVPIMSQINPVYTLSSCTIRLALPCNLLQSIRKFSLSCTLHHQNNTCTFLSHACHTPFHSRPSPLISSL